MWADRVVKSSLGRQALANGLATERDLRRIADGWLTLGRRPRRLPVDPLPRRTCLCRALDLNADVKV